LRVQNATESQPPVPVANAACSPMRSTALFLAFFFFGFGIVTYECIDSSQRQDEAKVQSIDAGKTPPEMLTVIDKYVTYQRVGSGYTHVVFRTSKDPKVDCVTTRQFYDSVNPGSTVTGYHFPNGYFIPQSRSHDIGIVKWFSLGFGVVLGATVLAFAFAGGGERNREAVLIRINFGTKALTAIQPQLAFLLAFKLIMSGCLFWLIARYWMGWPIWGATLFAIPCSFVGLIIYDALLPRRRSRGGDESEVFGAGFKSEREKAVRLGIAVSDVERDLPQFTRNNRSCKLVRGSCVKYSLPRHGGGVRSAWSLLQRTKRDGAQLQNGYLLQGDVSDGLRQVLTKLATEFSEEYYEFEGTTTDVAVFWEEYGGADQVQRIHQVLQSLAGL